MRGLMDYNRRNSIEEVQAQKRLVKIKHVLLVGSGKGGVGKSFISASIAFALSSLGLDTGILDLDIHGASIPNYLEVKPPLKSSREGLEPKKRGSLKVMSLALLTGDKPVPLHGERKESLVTHLFSQTNWGNLDYLIVDLPPGTGDEILTAFSFFGKKARLLLVTTAAPNAIKIVSKLRVLARTEKISVEGIVLNMSYMKSGTARVYPYGRIGSRALEKKLRAQLLGEVPLDPAINSHSLGNLLARRKRTMQIEIDRIVKRILYKS